MTPTISEVRAREILDSGGRPTVEVDLVLTDGTLARASVPSGASTGRHEAVELRDADRSRFNGNGVLKAVANIRNTVAPAVLGRSPYDQRELDHLLLELDGTEDRSHLGANALLAVSMAAARAAASASGRPLWQQLGGGTTLPLPMVNIISGGLHAEGGLAFQDFLIMPLGAESIRQALEWSSAVRAATGELLEQRALSTLKAAEGGFGPRLADAKSALDLLVAAVERAGLSLGDQVAFAIDVAATHFYDGAGYRLPEEVEALGASELVERLVELVSNYPIVSIEDGLAEDDWDGWVELSTKLAGRVQVLGDDLFTTNATRLQRGISSGVANAVLVKMNQIGTLTETLDVIAQAQASGYAPVISARSGETTDDFIADLAVGTSAGQIKIGSLAQSERLAKYNQLLRIEEQLGRRADFAGAAALAPLQPSPAGERRSNHHPPEVCDVTEFETEWQERFGRTEPKLVCIGLNYRDHASEGAMELPKAPLMFAKFANAICSDGDAIVLPEGIGHVDAEAELAVVIGEVAHRVPVESAYDVVAGYICANDVSARDAQFGDGQWFRGKGYDTFCPLGPRLVPASELRDPSDLRVIQRLNGKVLQDSRTSNLIFDIPTLISYASQVMTLLPGDLILTGTPDGVGVFRDPKITMKPGDRVEVEVEGIGVLTNPVVAG